MYGAITLCRCTFQSIPLITNKLKGCSGFARRYFRNLGWFLFLRVLRCFSSPRLPHLPMYSISDTSKRWVSPFGHPRIKACLTAPRGLSWPTTSFIASSCQGIHHVRFVAWPYNHGLFTTWLEVTRENRHRSLYKPRPRSHEKLLQLVTTSFVQIMHLYNLILIGYKIHSQH